MSTWDVALRIKSWEKARAVPAAEKLHLQFNHDFWICCPLAMAGEDPSLHAVLIGPKDTQGQIFCAPDPRSQRHRLELFSILRKEIEGYFQKCLEQPDGFPQLLLPSQSAVGVIRGLADYLSYLKEPKDASKQIKTWTEDARALGDLLQLYAQRSEIPGQQLLLVAHQILDEHWAFGQDLQGHLGAQLVWMDPPEDEDIMQAAAKAEAQPMGVKTDALMDNKKLAPALEAWVKVERSSSSSLASFRRQEIEDMLAEVLKPIWRASHGAYSYASELKPMLDVEQLRKRERSAFEYHMAHLADGGKFSRTDSSMRAIYSLAEREDAQEQYHSALIWGDRLVRERACLEGEILRGTTTHLPTDAGNKLVIISNQRWLKIRRGDEIVLMNGEQRVRAVVEDLTRSGDQTKVLLSAGNQAAWPENGVASDWAMSSPDWQRIHSERSKISRNLEEVPQTHQAEEAPEIESQPPNNDVKGGDPLATIEAMR